MRLIQSFAQFEEGSPYLQHKNKADYVYLSFYCFLLSHITIKKLYGEFTMICNSKAYNSMLQYIPYDVFRIMENDNHFKLWNAYKIDAMKTVGEDFIHIDPDVTMFEPLLDPFINGECDVLVQDIVPRKDNRLKTFIYDNLSFFSDTKILTKPYDGCGMSLGTVGINKYVQEYYFKGVEVLYEGIIKCGVENIEYASLILEEQLLYLLCIENDFNVHTILPSDLVSKYGLLDAGNWFGYLHIWRDYKYQRDMIDKIRKKIFFDYPDYYDYILKYERDVLSGFKFFKYMSFPKAY